MVLSVSIDLASSSARVTSVKFQKPLSVRDGQTSGPQTPGFDKKETNSQVDAGRAPPDRATVEGGTFQYYL